MRRKNLDHNLIQEYLQEALLKIMKTQNYDTISVGEIAKRAGVHRATFYRHFSSKEDIIKQYLYQLIHTSGDQSLLKKDFTAFIEPVFGALYAHQEEILLIHQAHLSNLFMAVLEDYFEFYALSQTPEIRSSMPLNKEDYAMAYRIGGIYFCLLLWFSHGMKETPQKMATIASSL